MEGISLSMGVEQRPRSVHVTYRVSNAEDSTTVYLFNILPTPDGFNSALAYICHAGGTSALFLQGFTPKPSGLIFGTQPQMPGTTRLLPGQNHEGKIDADLPLQEWGAYEPPAPGVAAEPTLINRIILRIDYMHDSAKFYADEYENFPGVFRANGHPIETMEAESSLVAPCTLLRRSETFHRFI